MCHSQGCTGQKIAPQKKKKLLVPIAIATLLQLDQVEPAVSAVVPSSFTPLYSPTVWPVTPNILMLCFDYIMILFFQLSLQ